MRIRLDPELAQCVIDLMERRHLGEPEQVVAESVSAVMRVQSGLPPLSPDELLPPALEDVKAGRWIEYTPEFRQSIRDGSKAMAETNRPIPWEITGKW
mgnify:CR=1 FL=1